MITERNALVKTANPFIVKLYYAFQSNVSYFAYYVNFCVERIFFFFFKKTNLYLVMEYCIGGDIASLLKKVDYFDENTARVYTAEIVLALEYLHSYTLFQ